MDINNIVNSTRTRNARLLDDINNKILNREYYKFKYLPFEGALPGLYFQQQTEDAINDIGNVAYATEKVADEALQVAQQAYNIALAALETANNALAAAQTAQQTANTALNIANNALSVGTAAATAAAAAQNRADEAYDLADAAQKAADAAQNTADAAQEAANSAANDAINALTKAESALTKIEQLSVSNYYNNVTEATDVNTLVDVHHWYLQASNNPNAPETNPGFLNVDNDYNDSVCKQLWVSETTGAIYNRFGQIVENSDPATVSSWSEWYKLATKADIDGTTTDLTEKITTVANNLATHEADFNNPHKVTAEQLGLTTVYQYKGSVATYADLPTTGQKVGDVWNVETADPGHGIKAGDNVAWDGAQWDILGGNHDLSGYAQLNSANTFTALNTFRANIRVSNGTAAGSGGSIFFGISPTNEPIQARISTDNLGGLFYHVSTNQPHVFRNGSNLDSLAIRVNDTNMYLSSNNNIFARITNVGVAKWLGNANTATKLETARTINGVAFDGTKDITIEAGGGGDVTAAGDNTFTGDNTYAGTSTFNNTATFNTNISVSAAATAGSAGQIDIGKKRAAAVNQANINAAADGSLNLVSTENTAITLLNGTNQILQVTGNSDTTSLHLGGLNYAMAWNKTNNGLTIRGGGDNNRLRLQSSANSAAKTIELGDLIELRYSGSSFTIGNKTKIINNSDAPATIILNDNTNGSIYLAPDSNRNKDFQVDGMGNILVANDIAVGSAGISGSGVIRANNAEQCLYFTGTAENTSYFTPNTGGNIGFDSSANCYLVNCAANNPSTLNIAFSQMNFKATRSAVSYMTKTLTFVFSVSGTTPTVSWTFPSGSTVYYPKGVAPTLTANANNIINVIAIVDDTESFTIQVCDTVALPFSG